MTRHCGSNTSAGHGESATCGKPHYGGIYQCRDCLAKDMESARQQLHDLAVAIHRRCYASDAAEFVPFTDASGLVGQIDNMVAGLMNDNAALAAGLRGKHELTGATYAHLVQERDQLRADNERLRQGAPAKLPNGVPIADYLHATAEQRKLEVGLRESLGIQSPSAADDHKLAEDAARYRYVSELAWYVEAGARTYNLCNINARWSDQRGSPDRDDVEDAIDKARLGKDDEGEDL